MDVKLLMILIRDSGVS